MFEEAGVVQVLRYPERGDQEPIFVGAGSVSIASTPSLSTIPTTAIAWRAHGVILVERGTFCMSLGEDHSPVRGQVDLVTLA